MPLVLGFGFRLAIAVQIQPANLAGNLPRRRRFGGVLGYQPSSNQRIGPCTGGSG